MDIHQVPYALSALRFYVYVQLTAAADIFPLIRSLIPLLTSLSTLQSRV